MSHMVKITTIEDLNIFVGGVEKIDEIIILYAVYIYIYNII